MDLCSRVHLIVLMSVDQTGHMLQFWQNSISIRSSTGSLLPPSQEQAHFPRVRLWTTSRHLRLIADWTPHWEAKCEEENERSLLTACHDFNMQFEQNRSWHVKPLKSVAMRLKSRRGNWHYLDMRSLKRTTLKSNKWQVSNCLNEIQLYIINKQLVRGSKRLTSSKHLQVSWTCVVQRVRHDLRLLCHWILNDYLLLKIASKQWCISEAFRILWTSKNLEQKACISTSCASLPLAGWAFVKDPSRHKMSEHNNISIALWLLGRQGGTIWPCLAGRVKSRTHAASRGEFCTDWRSTCQDNSTSI